MPSGTTGYVPDFAAISSFFGAQANDEGGYNFVGEHIPDNWVNRIEPYTNTDVTEQILEVYIPPAPRPLRRQNRRRLLRRHPGLWQYPERHAGQWAQHGVSAVRVGDAERAE